MQVRLKPKPTTYRNNNNNSSEQQIATTTTGRHDNMTAVHLQPSQPEYVTSTDDESTVLCQWKFNISGYQPSEVNVKVDADKLLVSARHADVKDDDNTSSRQLSKQMDIPAEVIHEEMTSYMTRDGYLVVQAPVARSRDNMTSSVGWPVSAPRSDSQELECRFRPIELPPEQPPNDDVISASRRHVITTGAFYCYCHSNNWHAVLVIRNSDFHFME